MSLIDRSHQFRTLDSRTSALITFLKGCLHKDARYLAATKKITNITQSEAAYEHAQFNRADFLNILLKYVPGEIGINSLTLDNFITTCFREMIFDPTADLRFGVIFVNKPRLKLLINLGVLESAIVGKYYTAQLVKKSVFQINTVDKNGDHSSGTGFRFADGRIVTNKHVLFESGTGNPYSIESIENEFQSIVPNSVQMHENLDIAYLDCDFAIDCPRLKIDFAHMLDEVIVLGFPRVGAAKSNPFSVSQGHVLGFFRTIFENVELAILDAKVTPGNSGGPVVNRYGLVCGIIVQDVEHKYEGGVSSHSTMIPVQNFAQQELKTQFDELNSN